MKEILMDHVHKYPEMKVQDAVKLIFQSEYGPGHLLKNLDYAKQLLKEEIELTHQDIPEIISVSDELVRFHLGQMNEKDVLLILDAMVKTAQEVKPDKGQFHKKLNMLKEMNLFSDEEIDLFLKDYLKRDSLMISHTEQYRNLYDPHYRILYRKYAEDLLKSEGKQ